MVRTTRGITLDIGGSEARGLPLNGRVGLELISLTGMTKIKPEDFRVKETDDTLGVMEIVDSTNGKFMGMLGYGITAKNYKGIPLTLSNQVRKTKSDDYYMQSLYVLAVDAMRVVQERAPYDNGNPHTIDYTMVTCIPLKEHSGNKDLAAVYKAAIAGTYTVRFPLIQSGPNTVSFRLMEKRIGVLPEGAVCMTAISRELDPEDISLFIDMGHVSTEVAIFKGKNLYGSTIETSNFAGGTLISNIRSRLAEDDIRVSDADVMSAMTTGYVKRNTEVINIADIIKSEKEAFVNQYMKPVIIDVLNSSNLYLQNIQNVVPIGASMNGDGVDGFVNTIVRECDLQNIRVIKVSEDLRYANISSAAVFTKALHAKAMNESHA